MPIVMVLVANPLGSGIVTNLRQPEANVTGITNIVAELAGKRIEILRELLPAALADDSKGLRAVRLH